ncbi:hypothetical protein ACHAW5_001743 [Stephanodiscus triporus]|uniref:DOMON domain-containing protein n=1 Tax=Stephanodiscus triporus TaxID=2934178 RepID=A0ABD3QXX2_9STRA
MLRPIGYTLATPFLLLASRSDAELTFTSLPIDQWVRNHLLVEDGSVMVRNVTSSGRSCYALYEKIDAMEDDAPLPDRGIVFGTGELLFGGTTTTIDDDDASPREDTGEPDYDSRQLSSTPAEYETASFDPCRIRFEFRCDNYEYAQAVDFGYVFASEEYRDGDRGYGASSPSDRGNDAIEVVLNGRNVALVQVDGVGGYVPVEVDSVNPNTNSRHFVEYVLDGRIVSADGFTVELGPYSGEDATTSIPPLLPGWNAIEFAIRDVGDANVDSWAFLRAGSFSCAAAAGGGDGAAGTTGGDAVGATASIVREGPRIPLMMAVLVAVVLGLIALSLPVIGIASTADL